MSYVRAESDYDKTLCAIRRIMDAIFIREMPLAMGILLVCCALGCSSMYAIHVYFYEPLSAEYPPASEQVIAFLLLAKFTCVAMVSFGRLRDPYNAHFSAAHERELAELLNRSDVAFIARAIANGSVILYQYEDQAYLNADARRMIAKVLALDSAAVSQGEPSVA